MSARCENINLRVTPEEKTMILAKAAKAGLTVTGFMLWEALGEELGQCIIDGFRKPAGSGKKNSAK